MAKRDKKKIIRVAIIGDGKTLRGLAPNMAAMNLAMFGSADPDFPNVSKETWEVAYPKLRRMNPFGLPMIVGAGSELSGAEYYKHIWDNEEKLNGVFVPMFGIDPYAFDKEAQGSFSGPYLMNPDEAYEKMIDAVKIPVDRFGEKLDEKLSKR